MSNQNSTIGYRLSPQQRRAWRTRVGNGAWRASVAITGSLDAARLRSTLSSLLAEYEIFRTRIENVGSLDLPLQYVDLPGSPSAIQTMLSQTGTMTHELHLASTCLHADFTTLSLLIEALSHRYRDEPAVYNHPLQYVDYADWANDMLEGPGGELGRDFWAAQATPDTQEGSSTAA